jgi:hypothetical protein
VNRTLRGKTNRQSVAQWVCTTCAKRQSLLAGFFFLVLLSSSRLIAKEIACCEFSANKAPIWQVFMSVPVGSSDGKCEWSYGSPAGTVAYTDTQRIVVGFHLQCAVSSPAIAAPMHTLDLLLQVDAGTGNVLNRMEWRDISTGPNRAGDLRILPTHDGRFLMMVGPFLKLFSADFKEERSRLLIKNAIGPEEYWVVQVAPDGRTGFFKHWNHYSPSEDRWLSTDTLEDNLVEAAPPEETWRSVVTAKAIYFRPWHPPPQSPRELVYVRDRGQPKAHPLCSDCDGLPMAIVPYGILLMQTGSKASFTLTSLEGKMLHSSAHGAGVDAISHVVVASAVPRFALEFGHLQRQVFSWKSLDTVVVFDTAKMTEVFHLTIHQQPKHLLGGEAWMGEAIALTPDGTRVAVLSGASLKVFQIPRA